MAFVVVGNQLALCRLAYYYDCHNCYDCFVVVVVVATMRLSVCAISYSRDKTLFNAKSFFVMDSAFISFHSLVSVFGSFGFHVQQYSLWLLVWRASGRRCNEVK